MNFWKIESQKRTAIFNGWPIIHINLPCNLVEQQNPLLEAAPMNDIGKVGILDYILLKPEKLDQSEFEIMKEHAQYGYDILNGSPSQLMQLGTEIALSHHEKYDGSDSPNSLKEEAIGFLREQTGKHFDRSCVYAFLQNMDKVLKIKEQFRDEYT